MERADQDRLVDEHFRYEANDDVDGVISTFADDASHHLIGSPYGEIIGKPAMRSFYEELFAALAGEHVEPLGRWYGEGFVVDDALWTGTVNDGRCFGLPGRSGAVSFRLLHVFQLRDHLITREQVWSDAISIAAALR